LAVRLRLRRAGKKKMPMYHIVAADSRAARTGKFLEIIGRYEPMKDPALVSTQEDRLFYWLGHGALPTDTVRSLLQRNGSWIKWSLVKKGTDEETISKEMEKWQMLQEAKRRREAEKRDARKARRKAAKAPAAPDAEAAPAKAEKAPAAAEPKAEAPPGKAEKAPAAAEPKAEAPPAKPEKVPAPAASKAEVAEGKSDKDAETGKPE